MGLQMEVVALRKVVMALQMVVLTLEIEIEVVALKFNQIWCCTGNTSPIAAYL